MGIRMFSTKHRENIIPTIIEFIHRAIWPVFIFILILINYLAVRNFYLLSTDTVYGNYSSQQLLPAPRYLPMRISKTTLTLEYGATNRLGADFAAVYFPALEISSLESAYLPSETLDPWQRSPNYAPLILGLCSITLCKLAYGYAALGNILMQLMIFFLTIYLAFQQLGISAHFLSTSVFIELCLFVTPAGLSWFERGQFSLYVAIAYLLFLLGLLRNNLILTVLSAAFAFIKWISLPFIFVVLVIYILNSKNKRELRQSFWLTLVFSSTFSLLLLPFIKGNILFIQNFIDQEVNTTPIGLSLGIYFPRLVVKFLPFALIVTGYVIAKINKGNFFNLIPFFAGVAAILLIYPTDVFDYSVPIVLGLIPLMILWARQVESGQRTARNFFLFIFLFFIVLASFSTKHLESTPIMIAIYIASSVTLIAAPIFLEKLLIKPIHSQKTKAQYRV